MGVTHLNDKGEVQMVDTSGKKDSLRVATAQAIVQFPEEVFQELAKDNFLTKKGGIFTTAKIAGTIAVKKTWDLIPLCHNIPISGCDFEIIPEENSIKVLCTVKTKSNTGVEMEALTGANVACLTIYDMCKALSHDIIIAETKLLQKSGGKRDFSRD